MATDPPRLDLGEQIARALVHLSRLEKELDREVELVAAWEQKAVLAVEAGNDALAKQALARKLDHENLVLEYRNKVRTQVSSIGTLRESLGGTGPTATTGIAVDRNETTATSATETVADFQHNVVSRDLAALKAKMGVSTTSKESNDDDEAMISQIVAEDEKKKRRKN